MKVERETHNIDATGKSLGRLASEIAFLLQGKNKSSFVPYWDMGDSIEVENVDKIKITGQKMKQKKYFHYSGYPGGLKEKTLEKLFEKNPADVLFRAVYNMLPKNKLRKGRMKRLKIK